MEVLIPVLPDDDGLTIQPTDKQTHRRSHGEVRLSIINTLVFSTSQQSESSEPGRPQSSAATGSGGGHQPPGTSGGGVGRGGRSKSKQDDASNDKSLNLSKSVPNLLSSTGQLVAVYIWFESQI